MMPAILSSIAPTSLGSRSKSFNIWPGFAVSGHTPIPKFFPALNLLSFPSIIEIHSSSTNPGSMVLSTITKEPGVSRSCSCFPTDFNAE